MLATIVDVLSQFIALCFKHIKELILLNTLYISVSNAKLYTYLQFQLSPRTKLIVNNLSQVGNIMTLKFTVQPSYNQMRI